VNAHNLIQVTTLQHTSSYRFLESLAHHQGVYHHTNSCLIFSACRCQKLFTTYYLCSRSIVYWKQ